MRNLKQKLQNSRGVSMIIAMVFMLFCLFVGGSVLTAATANASRVRHQASRQEYLDQRSAAILIQDALQSSDRTRMKLTVYDNGSTVRYYLPAAQELTALQRTVYESAILKHQILRKERFSGSADVVIENFLFKGKPIKSIQDFWVKKPSDLDPVTGTVHITGTRNTVGDLADFDAVFTCQPDYDYTVDFGQKSHLEIQMDAYVGTQELPGSAQEALNSLDTFVTSISWAPPSIQKGVAP